MDEAATPQDEAQQTHDQPTEAAYEPPELTVIGTIEELTQIEDITTAGDGGGSKMQ